MAIKQYFGNDMPGMIAGVPHWRGGQYFTASERIQAKIERHPWFKRGLITLVEPESEDAVATGSPEDELRRSTPVDWNAYIDGLTYKELQELAKLRDIRYVGVSAKALQDELKEIGG